MTHRKPNGTEITHTVTFRVTFTVRSQNKKLIWLKIYMYFFIFFSKGTKKTQQNKHNRDA